MDLRGSLVSYGAAIVEVLFVEKNTCLSDLNSTDKIILSKADGLLERWEN